MTKVGGGRCEKWRSCRSWRRHAHQEVKERSDAAVEAGEGM